MKTVGYLFILIGVLLTTSGVSRHMFSYLMIVAGVAIVTIYAMFTNNEKNYLCRIGFHKYKQIGWDREITSQAIYQCERCDQKKKVMRTA